MTDYNLEQDLKASADMVARVRRDDRYAQHLYAALCNMQWQRTEVWPLLKDEVWSCSWRYAGGLIAELRDEGDYIDWYCSGIGSDPEQGHVGEGTVTEQIAADLKELGWVPRPYSDND